MLPSLKIKLHISLKLHRKKSGMIKNQVEIRSYERVVTFGQRKWNLGWEETLRKFSFTFFAIIIQEMFNNSPGTGLQ
jgi:hypothetical protein